MADILFIEKQHRNTIKQFGSSVIPNVGDIVRFTDEPGDIDWEVKSREVEYFAKYDARILCVIQKVEQP